jgi:hypothetical protein
VCEQWRKPPGRKLRVDVDLSSTSPRGPRRRDLLKRCEYWLRAGEVPQARASWVEIGTGYARSLPPK